MKKSHPKSEHLNCSVLKTAKYLEDQNFNKLICRLFPETQSHLLQCPQLVTSLNYLRGKTSKLNEADIYSTTEKQKITSWGRAEPSSGKPKLAAIDLN